MLEAKELMEEATGLVATAAAKGDPCFRSGTVIAGMEMAAANYEAVSVLAEANGETTNAMKIRGVADDLRFNSSRLKRR